MPRILFSFVLLVIITSMISCNSANSTKESTTPLIYEGMPADELTIILGEPDSIQQGGTVYNADVNKTQIVEKWYYETRTVVLIDDTIKMPSLNDR